MKASRDTAEGVLTRNGDTILEDPGLFEALKQGLGFTPAAEAERYVANSRMMNRQTRIQDDRRAIMRTIGDAIMAGQAISTEVLDEMCTFNQVYPTYPITSDSIRQSVGSRMRASERNEFGIQLNPSLNGLIRDQEAALFYQ
jgi:hypothetical protein